MKIKRFVAPDMRTAFAMVRQEHGPDAVILSNRVTEDGVEIVAASNYDEALEHLRAASNEAPDHDHALYMLASVLALRDETDEAVPLLLRAIEINPDNRSLARHDPDLEALRQYEAVRAALDAAVPAKSDRRKAPKRR